MAKRKREGETREPARKPLPEESSRTALAHWSLETIWKMKGLLQEGKRETKRPSGAFRRKIEKVLGPMRACFQTRELPATDGKAHVGFVVADIKSLFSRAGPCRAVFGAVWRPAAVLEVTLPSLKFQASSPKHPKP